MVYTGTAPSTSLAVGDELPAAWTQEVAGAIGALMGAWTPYTPTLTQGVAVTKTVTYARYLQISKLVIATFDLTATSAGTSGSAIVVGLPVTSIGGTNVVVGAGTVTRTSAANVTYSCAAQLTTTTGLFFINDASTTNGVGGSPAFAIANTDTVRGLIIYEAA